jgi:hypothetical protein
MRSDRPIKNAIRAADDVSNVKGAELCTKKCRGDRAGQPVPWTAMRLQKLPPWEDSEEDLSSDAPRSSTFLGLCAPSRGFIVIDRVMSMMRKNSDEANHGGKPHRSRLVCIILLRSCTRLTCCEQKRASFSAAAMVNNLEFTLAPATMISSRDTTWPMLVMAFLGLDGSTVYPAVLYGPEDMASPPLSPGRPRTAPDDATHFSSPSRPTWSLLVVVIAINVADTWARRYSTSPRSVRPRPWPRVAMMLVAAFPEAVGRLVTVTHDVGAAMCGHTDKGGRRLLLQPPAEDEASSAWAAPSTPPTAFSGAGWTCRTTLAL